MPVQIGSTSSTSTVFNDVFPPPGNVDDWNNLPFGSWTLVAGSGGSSDLELRSMGIDVLERTLASSVAVAGTYRLSFDLNTQDTTALFAGLHQSEAVGKIGWRSFLAGPTQKRYSMVVEVKDPPGNDYQYFYVNDGQGKAGLHPSSLMQIDSVLVEAVTLDPSHTDQIALDHILRYNNPLSDGITDPQDVSSFELAGCWSDVFGNIHTGTITLDPWESIVLYKLPSPEFANLALDGDGKHHITTNTTWNTDMNIDDRVVVDSGMTLTIDGATIGFEETVADLVVQPGGTLEIINGAHLTSVDRCNETGMWKGVEVYGRRYLGPPYAHIEGVVEINTGSKISNALCAIHTGRGDPSVLSHGLGTDSVGGQVIAQNAYFENNLYGIVAKTGLISFYGFYYPGLPGGGFHHESRIQECTFRTTAPLKRAPLTPKTHVRLVDQWKVEVRGCNFSNDLTEHVYSADMGHGVEAIDSGVRIRTTPSTNIPNTFSNLDHAIHYVNTGAEGIRYLNINGNDFLDNICGVYASGAIGFDIRNNDFEMGRWDVALTHPDEEHWGELHRAIFSTGGYGFAIRDNFIERSDNTDEDVLTEGIVVGYTGDHNDVVWKNTAREMTIGFAGEGTSADISSLPTSGNDKGLQFQCNTNEDNATNLISRKANGAELADQAKHTIRGYQGTSTLAAANIFDTPPQDSAFSKTTVQIPVIRYYHPSAITYPTLYPAPVHSGILRTAVGKTWTNACSADPGGGGEDGGTSSLILQEDLLAGRDAYDALRQSHDQLLDGGDTEELVQWITDHPAGELWTLRDHLLERSPYLSGTALRQLVEMEGVPEVLKTELCVANPEATQESDFLYWAENIADHSLNSESIALIRTSWDSLSERGQLISAMADAHFRMTQAVNTLAMRYAQDTTGNDSLLWAWRQLRTNSARYAEVTIHLGMRNMEEAMAVLEAMPNEKELSAVEEEERMRMMAYVSVLATAQEQGRNTHRLNSDEVQQLEELVGTHYDRPAVWASNLLCTGYQLCRAPYTGGRSVPQLRSLNDPHVESATSTHTKLRLHPNPADSWVTVGYDVPVGTHGLLLSMHDISGRMITNRSLTSTRSEVLWDTRNTAPGVYLMILRQPDRTLGMERLIIRP